MSKIVQAINAMVANPDKITEVVPGREEYFFVYNSKFSWSIRASADKIGLWFYPNNPPLSRLLDIEYNNDWETVSMIHYSDDQFGTKEASDSFKELFALVKERALGIDKALDEIIADADL